MTTCSETGDHLAGLVTAEQLAEEWQHVAEIERENYLKMLEA